MLISLKTNKRINFDKSILYIQNVCELSNVTIQAAEAKLSRCTRIKCRANLSRETRSRLVLSNFQTT